MNRQSRAERQNTFDWLHILPVTVTISQYKSYSANGSYILPVEVTFCQQELHSAIMLCRNYLQFYRQFCSVLPFCSALPIQYHRGHLPGTYSVDKIRGQMPAMVVSAGRFSGMGVSRGSARQNEIPPPANSRRGRRKVSGRLMM